MYITELAEKKLQYTYCVFLILFDLICLYFIIDFLVYDEISGNLTDTGTRGDSTRKLAFLFFVNGMSNLFFVCVILMARLFKD